MALPSTWLRHPLLLGAGILLLAAGIVAAVLLLPRTPKEPAVPDRELVRPDTDPVFLDRAPEAGITFRMAFLPKEQGEKFRVNLYDHGCGVAVGDYNGDGYDDIYFCNQLGPNALYRNNRDGTFTDVAAEAGVGLGDRICVGATFADTRNNGLQDLFVTSTRGGNVFFRNLGNGKFKDVTKEAGLTHVGHSQTAVFFDYDNDGLLDLLVTNSAKWTTDAYDSGSKSYTGVAMLSDVFASRVEYNILYHNNGDGTFTDVTDKAGLKGKGWGGDVAVFDYDEDGYLDLLVTNMFGQSQLYHNNGDGTFTDVTKKTLGRTSFGAIGCKVFDFNNDGKLDLLMVDMHSDMWMDPRDDDPDALFVLLRQYEHKKCRCLTGPLKELRGDLADEKRYLDTLHVRYEDVIFGNTLFKNLGNGKFKEMSDAANVETLWPWGIVTGDFDNDGYEDIFLPSGMGYPFYYWPNYLLMNNGNETFTDRAGTLGIEPPRGGVYLGQKIGGRPAPRSSRCAAVADFDHDGRLDIITNNFNDRPYYFRNNLPRKNYIAFRLQGTECNRDAIGALVRIHVGKEVMLRQVNPAGGYLSQSSRTVHFGLGERNKIDRVEILWPGSKKRPANNKPQTIENPAINQIHEITQRSS